MQVSGLLIGVRRYSFPDKDTGEVIEGAKVILGVKPDDRQARDLTGLVPQDIKAPFQLFDALSSQGASLVGKPVVVDCEVTLRGRFTNLVATGIRSADKAAA